ncbi:MAG: hypothetical protein JWP57_3321 [Spirosoma sp.]|nr:hypothetical protein [Spirosoma sp.]
MWYFLIKQALLDMAQHRDLQRRAAITEIEIFNEPYGNWYIYGVERQSYPEFMDHLDSAGITYELIAERPSREEMLMRMR